MSPDELVRMSPDEIKLNEIALVGGFLRGEARATEKLVSQYLLPTAKLVLSRRGELDSLDAFVNDFYSDKIVKTLQNFKTAYEQPNLAGFLRNALREYRVDTWRAEERKTKLEQIFFDEATSYCGLSSSQNLDLILKLLESTMLQLIPKVEHDLVWDRCVMGLPWKEMAAKHNYGQDPASLQRLSRRINKILTGLRDHHTLKYLLYLLKDMD